MLFFMSVFVSGMTDEWFVSRVGNRKLSSFKVSKASVYVG